jgi:hypothetical protein
VEEYFRGGSRIFREGFGRFLEEYLLLGNKNSYIIIFNSLFNDRGVPAQVEHQAAILAQESLSCLEPKMT